MRFVKIFLLLFIIISVGSVQAQNEDSLYTASHYTKHEYMIPMRDGVKLFTVVYSPQDTSVKYPILLNRTPYSVGPYGESRYKSQLGPSSYFEKEGFIFAYQDVRGRFMSEGTYMDMRPYIAYKKSNKDVDESSDTYDTIDWLVKHVADNNGRVGLYGISYPGFYTAIGVIDAHPALKAASPQAPIADWFIDDDFHRHGAFWLPHAFWFYSIFGIPRPGLITEWPKPVFTSDNPDGYDFFLKMGSFENTTDKYYKHQIPFWDTMMAHPNYDAFWQSRNSLPHFYNIKPAVMTVGGWFDAEDLYGALNTYKSIEEKNPGKTDNTLVMGPWFHGGWERSTGEHLGDIHFGSNTSEYYQKNIELPFFNYYLKGEGSLKQPEAYVFETGKDEWRKFDEWPPKNVKDESLYLLPGNELSFNAPSVKGISYDEYVSDPKHPVPYTEKTTTGMIREYMDEDQRFASRRPDVLVYETGPLDKDVTIAGPLQAELYVSTSGTDADWIVKLIDVYPDTAKDNDPNPCGIKMGGYQMMVRGDIMRGKYRNSWEKPEPFVPGKVTKVSFNLQDIFHSFLKGHRIMIQIQSSWFPLADLNPQKFINIYHAKASDFQKAVQKVYHSKQYPSCIKVMVLQ
jgi:putative CocE/NonD family hydrolase